MMSNSKKNENESVLILRAFLLDTQIEHPELVAIAHGKNEKLLSELFANSPSLRQKMLEERADVYRQLGWEIEA